MIKTITINGRDVTLSNNAAWAFEYNDQFGHDVIQDVMPMLAGMVKAIGGVLEETGGDVASWESVIAAIGSDAFDDAYIYFATVKLTDIVNICWAMAKAADETIPEPRRWVRDLGDFPLDEIVPVLADLLLKGMVSSKNRERLQSIKAGLQPKNA